MTKKSVQKADKKTIVNLIIILVFLAALIATIHIVQSPSGSLGEEAVYCEEHQRDVEVCTMEYNPVCAYDSEGNMLGTQGNSCVACSNEEIAYYLPGECEE